MNQCFLKCFLHGMLALCIIKNFRLNRRNYLRMVSHIVFYGLPYSMTKRSSGEFHCTINVFETFFILSNSIGEFSFLYYICVKPSLPYTLWQHLCSFYMICLWSTNKFFRSREAQKISSIEHFVWKGLRCLILIHCSNPKNTIGQFKQILRHTCSKVNLYINLIVAISSSFELTKHITEVQLYMCKIHLIKQYNKHCIW